MSLELSQQNARNCNSLLCKFQDRWVFCTLLFVSVMGVLGFSDKPVTTLVSRDSAELIVLDVLAQPTQPVLLSARLIKTRLFMQTGLGGEPIDFLVDGAFIGQSMTGGDGWVRKEFTPTKTGILVLTVKLSHAKRVKAEARTGIIGALEQVRPIVLVELDAAMMQVDTPKIGPFDLSVFGQGNGGLSEPMPEAAEALVSISKRASLVYFLIGNASSTPDVHAWLAEHTFPPGPVFMLEPGTRALPSKVEGWKDDGWTNIKAGISRNVESVEEYVHQDLAGVMLLHEDEEEDIPEGVIVVSEWKDIGTLNVLKFEREGSR